MAKVTPEQKQEIYDAIAKVYAVNSVGGVLHIVLDDLNVDDHSIKWCIDKAMQYYPEKNHDVYRRCAELLLNVHKKQRVRLIENAHKRMYAK